MMVRLSRLLGTFLGCILAYGSMGQALMPPLGAAAGFALFTAAGAFDNVGLTVVQGNIGTQAGAFTGFPAGVVVGSVNIANAYSGQVAADVAIAYNYLTTSVLCGTMPIVALGGHPAQTLLPGVYCLGGARTLADHLVLDGGGSADAVFVIKIGGALTTADLSTVTLTNGASAANVYWQVGGRVELGANSTFSGTILADGAINMLPGATLQGRGLSIAGSISLNSNIVNSPSVAAPLPVSLVAFSAVRQGRTVLLQWATASESHAQDFTPERSATGTDAWEPVGTLLAAGSSSTLRQYRMVDNGDGQRPAYYRLRSTDTDGTSAFSQVRFVALDDKTGQLVAFPNPATGLVVITGSSPGSTLTLLDMAGRVLQQPVVATSETNYLDISLLAPNNYVVKMSSANGKAASVKLVKE